MDMLKQAKIYDLEMQISTSGAVLCEVPFNIDKAHRKIEENTNKNPDYKAAFELLNLTGLIQTKPVHLLNEEESKLNLKMQIAFLIGKLSKEKGQY